MAFLRHRCKYSSPVRDRETQYLDATLSCFALYGKKKQATSLVHPWKASHSPIDAEIEVV